MILELQLTSMLVGIILIISIILITRLLLQNRYTHSQKAPYIFGLYGISYEWLAHTSMSFRIILGIGVTILIYIVAQVFFPKNYADEINIRFIRGIIGIIIMFILVGIWRWFHFRRWG